MFTCHQYMTLNSLNGIIWKETHSIIFKNHVNIDVSSICKQFFFLVHVPWGLFMQISLGAFSFFGCWKHNIAQNIDNYQYLYIFLFYGVWRGGGGLTFFPVTFPTNLKNISLLNWRVRDRLGLRGENSIMNYVGVLWIKHFLEQQ